MYLRFYAKPGKISRPSVRARGINCVYPPPHYAGRSASGFARGVFYLFKIKTII